MLRLVKTRTVGTRRFDLYEAEEPGDEIPLHDHRHNHLTRVVRGEVEIYDGAGKVLVRARRDGAMEIPPRRPHAIRGLTPHARFLNVSPVL